VNEPQVHATLAVGQPCPCIPPTSVTPMQMSREPGPGEEVGGKGTMTLPAGAQVKMAAVMLNIPGFAAILRCPECGEQHIVFQEWRPTPKESTDGQ
jgi:hypothetical protein